MERYQLSHHVGFKLSDLKLAVGAHLPKQSYAWDYKPVHLFCFGEAVPRHVFWEAVPLR